MDILVVEETIMVNAAFFLMCFAIGCSIARSMAKKEGNVTLQNLWELLGALSVGLALILYGLIAFLKGH